MMLVDANVLMYANGAEHQHKPAALEFLRRVAARKLEATIDAEVLQEILHRYTSVRRMRDALEVYELARDLFPNVLPITAAVMDQARDFIAAHPNLSARDAVHAAVVRVNNLEGICTFDRDFDLIPAITRITP